MRKGWFAIIALLLGYSATTAFAQSATPLPEPTPRQKVRTWTIPISIFTKKELKDDQASEFIQADKLTVKENGDDQQILSIRTIADSPLSLAVVIQEDLISEVNLQLNDLRDFIRRLPKGSRVMVAYIRGGSTITLQKFTEDLEKAAKSLRIVGGGASSGNGPFSGVNDVLKRFEAMPTGRRAILLVSDGVDTSQGTSPASLNQTIDLDNAVTRAQRYGVAVYSFYSPTAITANGNSRLVSGGQGALQRLSDETGGRSFYQGSLAPVTFQPFFRDLNLLLGRQFALTYLSTHMKKRYYRVEVTSTNPEVKIEHPMGYYYR